MGCILGAWGLFHPPGAEEAHGEMHGEGLQVVRDVGLSEVRGSISLECGVYVRHALAGCPGQA